ncbi:MAG: TonB-dependent receptor [Bacteroidota bacterium]|nr:TonB-dependent receptor [Bacteroidota bacterium]
MKYVLLFLSILFAVALSICQEIQPDTTKIYPMREVVVTATRSEKNPLDVGRSISVIANGQIKQSINYSFSDLISSSEGIYIVGTGQNPGANQSIFMRGTNSNQTMLMIDGVRIIDLSSPNNAPDLSELSLSNLERVEIVRGLNSTLYGSSAIGGVVSMISRKNQKEGINTQVELIAGSFGKKTSTLGEDIFLNYTSSSGLYFNTEFNNLNVKGLDATIDTVTDPNVYKNRDRDGYKNRDWIGKIGFVNDKLDIYASFKSTDQIKDLDKQAFIDDDNYTLDFKRNLLTYGASYKLNNNLSFKFIGGISDIKRTVVNDSSIIDKLGNNDHTYYDETWKGQTSTQELQMNVSMKDMDFVFGGGLYKESMTSKSHLYSNSQWGEYESDSNLDTLDLKATTYSTFVRSEINGELLEKTLHNLSLALGGRFSNHSSFRTNFVYEINPSFKLSPSSLVYASYATGFNAPSLYQLYAPNRDFDFYVRRGNDQLKPENSKSFEIGLKQSVNGTINFGVSYFYTLTNDIIEYVYEWDKNIGVDTLRYFDYRGDTYLNLGEQTIRGIEFTIDSKINDKLQLIGNVCLVDGGLKYQPSDVDTSVTHGNHLQLYSNGAFMNQESEYPGLVRRPSVANLSFIYLPVGYISLKVDLKYIGRKGDVYYNSTLGPMGALGTVPVSDYTLFDVSTRFNLGEHVWMGLRFENVFNVKYNEIKGFTTRGRGIYLNIRYSISSGLL